jgi:Undecaprenyl-phosphate glucose phosphotransferase
MLRRHHRFFQSLQIIRDAAVVGLAFYLAYVCRFSFPAVLPFHMASSIHETLAVGLMLVMIWPLVGYAGGLYVSRRSRTALSDVFDVFKTTGVALVGLVTLTYFVRDVRYSRAVLLLWALFCVALQALGRLTLKALLRRVRAQGHNLRHVLIIGGGELLPRVHSAIVKQAGLGLRVAGVVQLPEAPGAVSSAAAPRTSAALGMSAAPDTSAALNMAAAAAASGAQSVPPQPEHPTSMRELGPPSALQELLQRHQIDQVIVALPIDMLGALRGIMDTLSRETVDVRLVPDFYQYMTLCGSIDELCGLPIINLQSTPLFGWNMVIKRSFDVLAALGGLLVVSPLMALIALAIRLNSRGPIFYRQVRVGMDGQQFAVVKFRTMVPGAETAGATMAVQADPRCTPLGAWLRRLSLDELPQLYNVLCGHMSLVGPRPERPCFIESFKQEIPRYALRHKIKAGMTGWAQVHGMRGNTSIAKRIELDLYYIENWSLLLDIKILLRTVLGGFISPHAY